MLTLSDYHIKEQLYEGLYSAVYRAIRQTDNQSVILKRLKADYPTPEDIARFKREYEITHTLNKSVEGIAKVFGLQKHDNTWFIVLEDFWGESLTNRLQTQPIEIEEFLRLAIQVAEIVGEIHHQNVIHKDINPSNLIWNPDTTQIKLIDFGISTVLSRENPSIRNLNSLEGTLTYMSPEQTGRMNRAMDYRTDFYSLGVTFYQMLTQHLPFEADDAMELVHCHLAKKPPAPHDFNSNIPAIISKIILKLMAKTAEERYQNALGLKADLQKCLAQLDSTARIDDFELSEFDISEKFQIPQKLYGREQETERFLSAFERVSTPAFIPATQRNLSEAEEMQGLAEMMLVAGYSGIGKSVLVQEIYKPLTEKRGYFISGKFDQFQRNVPYSALVNAFSDLVRQLFTETEEQLNHWQEKLLSALGPNSQVIIDVIPELELITGPVPPVPALGPTEAQNRFNLIFQRFISVFCQSSHPLVMFLDDLQWADSATLKLMELIMTHKQMRYLFLIGAYRDNEVSATHPLRMTLDKLRQEGAIINQITLAPLTLEHITQLIADTLHTEPKAVQSLAELVTRKTGGNPFFINQFLNTLYEEQWLSFDIESMGWQWEIAQIEGLNITDNVVELMIGKLKKLPEATQQVLRLAACVGNRFDLNTLSVIDEHSAVDTFQQLMPALADGLVLPTAGLEIVLPTAGLEMISDEFLNAQSSTLTFQFLHDRVQQAAYALIDEEHKKAAHLRIGRLLLANTTQRADKLFELVDHLNAGGELVTEEAEKIEIAQWNLKAGQKAKLATAYEVAVNYLTVSMELLPADSWQTQYDITLALYLEAMEAEYLNTHFAQSEQLVEIALHQAKTLLEKVKVYEIQIQSSIAQNQMTAAIETGRHVLEMLGIKLDNDPPSQELIIEDLINLPLMTDTYKLAAMRILMTIMSPAFIANPALLAPIAFTMVNQSLKHGNSPLATYAYVFYGLFQCASIEQIESGYRFGQLALKLLDKLNATELKAKIHELFNAFIRPWKEHPRQSLEPLRDTIQAGLETGDLEYACYAAIYYCTYPFLMGEPLESVEQKYESYTEMIHKFKYEHAFNYLSLWRELVSKLRSLAAEKKLQGPYFNEAEMLPLFLETQNSTSLFAFYTAKAIFRYVYKDDAGAVENARLADQYVEGGTGMITAAHNLYYSLALLAHYPAVEKRSQTDYLEQVATNQQKLKIWAKHAPMNFHHKHELVEAEKARVLGQVVLAMALYERAIKGARDNGYIQEEALAYELAAEFYLVQGMEEFVRLYITKAHYGYQQWGAVAKVEDLEERYPQFFVQATVDRYIPSLMTTTTLSVTTSAPSSESGLSVLDLETVMKASQALAGEVQLDKLLATLMNILIENAGAEKGFLLLETDNQWFIQAEGTLENSDVKVLESVPIEPNSQREGIATTLINYVARTTDAVVLDDAVNDGHFTRDPYIIARQSKSVLCVPLVNQGKLAGIVYLENNLVTGAFTPKRLETVQLLGAQAAISLDNARLYEELAEYNRTLEAKVAERTQELSQALEHLKATQEELVQSEKMAALGQLVAGIAHEINTPLGAIQASIGNISDALNESIHQLPQLFQRLTPSLWQDFFALLEAAFKGKKNLTSREERKFKRKLIAQLEDYEIDNADDIADTLVDMGIYDEIEQFVPLLQAEDNTLQAAYNLSIQQTSSQNIMMAVERASKIVFALKSYAHSDSQGHQIKANVTEGIDVVLTLYYNQLKHGIEITTRYQDVPDILCSPDELNQVWTNIIHNAIQAMDNRGTLEITVAQQDDYIVVQITDSGKGIEEDIKPRIFEPFFTTKPAGEGSGLGLDIVRRIIDKHQGRIDVESRPGKTTFSVFLPVKS